MVAPQVRALLISLVSWQAVFGACPDGFFEQECKLPCRCRTSKTCGPKGECPNNGLCAFDYFGPGCQYVDLVQRYTRSKAPTYFNDGDDSTCNPDKGQTILTVSIGEYASFWFRVVVTSPEHLKPFNYSFFYGSKFRNEKSFTVNNKTVDTWGLPYHKIYDFILNGPIVGQLCSLYISGGFSLNTYANITQTSNYETDLKKCGPYNAIDNNFSNKYEDHSCAATAAEKPPNPKWIFTLPREVNPVNFELHNTKVLRFKTIKFYVDYYNNKGNLTYHTEFGGMQVDVYRLSLVRAKDMSQMVLQHDDSIKGDDRIFFICEIVLLLENICPEHNYGLTCNDPCTCDKSQVCSPVTGACAQICPVGFYGQTCNTACNDKCIDKICEYVSGNCVKCPPGKTGKSCDEDAIVCKPGTYGPACVDCSVGCSDTCAPLTGYCTCKAGFAGENCSEKVCPENKYGPTCSDICTCDKSQKCNGLTGACTQICPIGFYGPTCTTACSDHCIDNICEHVSGNCIKCAPGFSGKICDEECRPGTYGASCRLNCSEGCTEACNKVTGHCDCKANFEGLDCAECKGNAYGPNCDIPCSSSCLNSTCDPKTGKCLACRQSFSGEFCKGCVVHYYGKMCEQMCSEKCLNRTCDGVTGVCDSCPDGFTGPTCEDNVGALKFTPYWLLLTPPALLACCCLFLFLRRRVREEPEEARKRNRPGFTPQKKEGSNKEKP